MRLADSATDLPVHRNCADCLYSLHVYVYLAVGVSLQTAISHRGSVPEPRCAHPTFIFQPPLSTLLIDMITIE